MRTGRSGLCYQRGRVTMRRSGASQLPVKSARQEPRSAIASWVTYKASPRKHAPPILKLNLSLRSRFSTSVSTDIRHSRVAPDVTSRRLSIPKPTSEMLPASTPAPMPIKASTPFQTIVKCSRRFPPVSRGLSRNCRVVHRCNVKESRG